MVTYTIEVEYLPRGEEFITSTASISGTGNTVLEARNKAVDKLNSMGGKWKKPVINREYSTEPK